MGKNNEQIDFVIPWLDGNDPKWREQMMASRAECLKTANTFGLGDANDACRYREMGLLRYWFRGVEKFAPWVNKIYFVTCGQKPEWLDENHPKLVLVDHKDYIPSDYLPTFNSIPIELNLHRIHSLSEHFVLFNDDVFLIKNVAPDYFFKNGDPVLPCNLKTYLYYRFDGWSRTCFNNYCVVNQNFNIKKTIWENRRKWFNIRKLGLKRALLNIAYYGLNKTTADKDFEHLATPHLKSTLQNVWNTCTNVLEYNSQSRFRTSNDINHWLLCAWNMAQGHFYPVKPGSRGENINVSRNQIGLICDTIKRQRMSQVCLNDTWENDDPDYCFMQIRLAFDSILPEASSFEKQ